MSATPSSTTATCVADAALSCAAKLLDGDIVNGPALIVQHNSTTLLPPGYRAAVLSHGDMHIARR